MLTLEEHKARYSVIERDSDEFGRIIGVRLLKLTEQIDVDEMAPNSRNNIPLLAAAVCEIDGRPLPFPRSHKELYHVIDLLDAPGLKAVVRAWDRLNGVKAAEPKSDSNSGLNDDESIEEVDESEMGRAKK